MQSHHQYPHGMLCDVINSVTSMINDLWRGDYLEGSLQPDTVHSHAGTSKGESYTKSKLSPNKTIILFTLGKAEE